MKRFASLLMVAVLALTVTLNPLAAPAAAQDDANPLLDLLALVPQAATQDSALVTYGDIAAWHAATGIPRVDDVAGVEALTDLERAWLLYVMPRQTAPPSSLGIQYLFQEDMRPAYGFDLFAVDRFVATDTPPANITVIDTGLDPARVGDALLATGYAAEAIDGGTFYRILDDYETALGADLPRVGILGTLNRIVVLDAGRIVIGRADEVAQSVLDARAGALPALDDDPRYVAAADALHQLSQSDVGALVGAIFHNGMVPGDPAALLGQSLTEEEIAALQATLTAPDAAPLPPNLLAAFGTYRGQGATFLALAVVFPPGVAATQAADALAARLTGYVSLTTREPLGDRWTFDRAFAAEDGGLPVAVVVMRVADPPPPAEGERPDTAILAWMDLIYRRDLGFLVPSS